MKSWSIFPRIYVTRLYILPSASALVDKECLYTAMLRTIILLLRDSFFSASSIIVAMAHAGNIGFFTQSYTRVHQLLLLNLTVDLEMIIKIMIIIIIILPFGLQPHVV